MLFGQNVSAILLNSVANGDKVLYTQGIPFRTSHDIVGRSVALCVSGNCQLKDVSLPELQSISPAFEEDVYEFLGVENSIKKFSSYGSTGSGCVSAQLEYWVAKLDLGGTRDE